MPMPDVQSTLATLIKLRALYLGKLVLIEGHAMMALGSGMSYDEQDGFSLSLSHGSLRYAISLGYPIPQDEPIVLPDSLDGVPLRVRPCH